jgi:RNA polymerase sigma-70 factor (ECF subfamily)
MQDWTLKQAFENLRLPYLDSLYSFALILTGNRPSAEDLVWHTFLKAHCRIRSAKHGTNYKCRLFTILHTLFIHQYFHGEKSLSDANTDEREACDYQQPPAWGIHPVTTRKALDELPEGLKVVILLKDVFEFDYQEIAGILGCPVETVSARLWRGRALLKKKLNRSVPSSARPIGLET